MAARAVRKSITENELALRDSMWPDAEARLWDRKASGGFVTVPKTMPLLNRMMDEMSKNHPVSSTYAALWAYTWDNNAFVRLNKPDELAFSAGFSGQRGVRTLQDRLKRLEALGFIELKAAGLNRMAFAYLPNPHAIIFGLHDALHAAGAAPEVRARVQGLQDATFNAFLARAQELGCQDVRALIDDRAPKPPPTAEPDPKPERQRLRIKPSPKTVEQPRRKRPSA